MSFTIHTFKMPHGVRTYLVVDNSSNKAVIIDPTTESKEVYYEYLTKNSQIELTHVLDTHTHADHVSLAKELKQKYPQIRYAINTNAPTASKDIPLHDGEIIQFGESSLVSLYTPGHTNDCMTFVGMSDGKRYIFTGDIMLINGTGRTDFQEGDSQKSYDSIMQLIKFSDDTVVCPGHDYDDLLVTTIGELKLHNSRVRLALDSEQAFKETMNKYKPPLPDLIAISLSENSK